MQIVIHDNRVVATHADGQGLASLYPGCLILTVPDGTSVAIGQPWDVDLDAARAGQLAAIRAACDAALDPLAASYPDREVQSWPQQIAEATALESDPTADAPLVRQMAAARSSLGDTQDERVAELARRIRQNAADWSAVAGPIIGRRQALEDAVAAAATVEEVMGINIESIGGAS